MNIMELLDLKTFFVCDLIEKNTTYNRTYYENRKRKYKEKKRLLIEQIKKERQENSLIFNGK